MSVLRLQAAGTIAVALAVVALQACGPSASERERNATADAGRAWLVRRGGILQYATTLLTETKGDTSTWSTYRGIGTPPPAAPQHPKVLKKPYVTRAEVIAAIAEPDISGNEEYYSNYPELALYWCMRSFPTYNPSDFVRVSKTSGYSLRGGMTITTEVDEVAHWPMYKIKGFIPVLEMYYGKNDRLTRIIVWDDRGREVIGRTPEEWHWSG